MGKKNVSEKAMTVGELVEQLESLDQALPVHVFRGDGDYGTPQPALIYKSGRPHCIAISAAEDE